MSKMNPILSILIRLFDSEITTHIYIMIKKLLFATISAFLVNGALHQRHGPGKSSSIVRLYSPTPGFHVGGAIYKRDDPPPTAMPSHGKMKDWYKPYAYPPKCRMITLV